MVEGLHHSVALVTGASSGIGHATALRLAKEGARVALVARRGERLKELAEDIRAFGGEALPIAADITSADEAVRVVAKSIEDFGRLDTLINNAGVMLYGPTLDATVQEWQAMVNVNLLGLLYMTKAALPHLLAAVGTSPRKVVDVVNVSSVAGRFAAPTVAVYNATKFAVTAATEAWRQEFTKRSVRFSVVEPGATTSELFDQKAGQREIFKSMFGEVEELHAEDIADAIAFIVTQPRRVAINEIVVRPTDQA